MKRKTSTCKKHSENTIVDFRFHKIGLGRYKGTRTVPPAVDQALTINIPKNVLLNSNTLKK